MEKVKQRWSMWGRFGRACVDVRVEDGRLLRRAWKEKVRSKRRRWNRGGKACVSVDDGRLLRRT